MQWAMKCSAVGVRVNDKITRGTHIEWRDVYKDPITDSGKRSKRGRVTLWKSGREYFSSVDKPKTWTDYGVGDATEVLEEVYRDGVLIKEITFDEVRANARK